MKNLVFAPLDRFSPLAFLLAASCAASQAEAPTVGAASPAPAHSSYVLQPAAQAPAQAPGPEGEGGAQPSTTAPEGAVPFGPEMQRPVRLSGRDPGYTLEAVEARVEGKVLVKCVITVEGKVENCRVLRSLPWLDQEVLSALKTQRYTPVTFKGRLVPVFYMFPFNFRLPPGSGNAASPTTPPLGPGDTEQHYANDLRSICHVHELSGQPPDKGPRAVVPWLVDNIRTSRARRQLAQIPHVDLLAWHQNLRREAAARGISPCPFADTWEPLLKRPS